MNLYPKYEDVYERINRYEVFRLAKEEHDRKQREIEFKRYSRLNNVVKLKPDINKRLIRFKQMKMDMTIIYYRKLSKEKNKINRILPKIHNCKIGKVKMKNFSWIDKSAEEWNELWKWVSAA